MARIIAFLGMCVAIVLALSLRNYITLPVVNKSFNYEETKKQHDEQVAMMAAAHHTEEAPVEEEAPAEPTGPLVVLDTEELKRGSEMFQKCMVCHGKAGEGKASQKAPKIGGQHDWYVSLQVKNMRDGVRINKIMQPYVKNLSDQDIADLAAYISKLPW